jgi:hypothetical protein
MKASPRDEITISLAISPLKPRFNVIFVQQAYMESVMQALQEVRPPWRGKSHPSAHVCTGHTWSTKAPFSTCAPVTLHLNCLRIEGLSVDVVGLTLCAWLFCKQPSGRACWSYESPPPPSFSDSLLTLPLRSDTLNANARVRRERMLCWRALQELERLCAYCVQHLRGSSIAKNWYASHLILASRIVQE